MYVYIDWTILFDKHTGKYYFCELQSDNKRFTYIFQTSEQFSAIQKLKYKQEII